MADMPRAVNPDQQVMSAQAESAQLREDDDRAQLDSGVGAVETGAVESGTASGAAASGLPQMNGASDGRSEKGAGGHQAHGLASARNVVIEEGPRGSGAVFSQMTGDVQETQTRTDIGAQGTAFL